MRRLLTARRVAEDYLDVCPETVLRWHRQGKIPGVRLPSGAIRFHPQTLEDWIAERATSGDTPSTQARALTRVGGVSDQEES